MLQIPEIPEFEPTGPATHVIYADETNWNVGRFRAVGSVSCPIDLNEEHTRSLRDLLDAHGIRELKWKEINGGKKASGAAAAVDWFLQRADLDRLRIDVLCWDTTDPIHLAKPRKDSENLEVKYYHLLKQIMRFRWPESAVHRVIPDHIDELNWTKTRWFLTESGANRFAKHPSSAIQQHRVDQVFHVESIQPEHSHLHPLIQLADLFAGMITYSYEQFDRLDQWVTQDAADPPMTLSQTERVRFPLLRQVYDWCSDRGLFVLLPEYGGFQSMIPILPLNFWLWESPSQRFCVSRLRGPQDPAQSLLQGTVPLV